METTVKQLTLVVLFLCISSAVGLQCMSCTDGSCSSQTTVNCSSEEKCLSAIYTGTYLTENYTYMYKGCGSPYSCPSSGSQYYSYNYGTWSSFTNTTCCDSDNCNSANITTPPAAGSLQCYGCDPYSYECTANVSCNELEVCGQATSDSYYGYQPLYGCVSKNMCYSSLSQQVWGYNNVSCCNSTNCNVPDLGLQCMTCTDSTCSSQHSVTCSKLSPMCVSQISTGSYGNDNYTSVRKGCGSPSECTAAGSQYYSYHYGTRSYFTNTTCCDSDNCNSANITTPPAAGSLQCYGCDPYSYECTANVSCNELEVCGQATSDSYYSYYYGYQPLYGCVSENLCDSSLSQQVFGYYRHVSCCNSTNCNVPAPRLRCMSCADSTCSSQYSMACSPETTMCYSYVYSGTYGTGNYTYMSKGCGSPYSCQYYSYNYGSYSYFINTTCCDSDNCNSANITTPPAAGSLQCYGCDPNSYECTANVSCNKLEVCGQVTSDSYYSYYRSQPLYGCVSENLCNSSLSQQVFGYYRHVSCCNSTNCNVPGDPCRELNCTEDEKCIKENGVYECVTECKDSSGKSVSLGVSFWTDRTCTEKCTCSKSGLSCYNEPCPYSQVCGPGDYQFFCQSIPKGTCSISGDPHYFTFDGIWHHFQGSCTYVLSQQCGVGLPYYRVEGSNEHRGNTRVTWTRLVRVFVYNETIELVKGHPGEAKVNGVFAATPFLLNNGTVQVYGSGFSVVVSTAFGLEVSYDTNHYVIIKLPYSYQNATCGLCGNFNGDSNDDFQTPQGEVVSSNVFGNSWQVPGADEFGCEAGCEGLDCPVCTTDQKVLFSDADHCGILQNSSGPFAACHPLLSPKDFADSCVYDLCLEGGHQHILCQALNVYARRCQENGIQLPNWRRPGFCEIDCPANSHFESQATGCPATCVNPNSPDGCVLPLQETCLCNEGYLLSGGACVPQQDCGCSFEGHYYYSNQTVILDEDCGRLCQCSSGAMTCDPYGCGPHELCQALNGERGCRSKSHTCSASGDPHYHTFDQKAYDFQGNCRYVLATLCNDTTGLHNFSVEAKNEALAGSSVSVTAEVYVNVWGFHIVMSGQSSIEVNCIKKKLPLLMHGGLVSVYASGQQMIVDTDFGLHISFDGRSTVSITVPFNYSGNTCGLCGNFNENPDDDFRTPSGEIVTSLSEFGTSWKVPGNYTCSDDCGSSCPQCLDDRAARAQCEVIHATEGPFTLCHQHLEPAPYFNDCVFDVCIGGEELLCRAIQAYAAACQSANVQIYSWRNSTSCNILCPANSHYELCGSDCGRTCASSMAVTCERVCSEGCFCDQGFVRSGTKCVSEETCGCQYNGFYYNAGESFWTEGCSQRCECHALNNLSCNFTTCPPKQDCTIRNGHLGCYPKGLSTTAPGLSTTVPGLSTTAPGLFTTAPGLSTTAPGLSTTAPGLSTTAPGLSTTSPGLSTTAPGLSTSANTTTDDDDDDDDKGEDKDCSLFSAARSVLPLHLLMSLLGIFIFTHTLYF